MTQKQGRIAKKYCEACKARNTCRKPCPPVQTLLDSITAREPEWLPAEFVREYRIKDAWPQKRTVSTKKAIIHFYFEKKMETADIADVMHCSRRWVQRVIHDVKDDLGVL